MLKPKSRLFTAALLVLACLGISACGQMQTKQELTEADIAALEQRVRERWQTLIDKDFAAAWEYASPNYRAVVPKNMFRHNFSYTLDWQLTGIEVVAYDADAAVASVAVRVMSRPVKQTSISAQFGALPSTIREKWVSIDGEWWHSTNG